MRLPTWHQEPEIDGAARIGRNEDGSLDEVVVHNVASFHIEQMNARDWWIGLELADGRRITLAIWSKARVHVRADAD